MRTLIATSILLLLAACGDAETEGTPTSSSSSMGGEGGAAGGTSATGGSGGAHECDTDAQCPGFAKECRYPVCVDNTCALGDAPSGALCDEGDDRSVCDGAGICVKNLGAACLVYFVNNAVRVLPTSSGSGTTPRVDSEMSILSRLS